MVKVVFYLADILLGLRLFLGLLSLISFATYLKSSKLWLLLCGLALLLVAILLPSSTTLLTLFFQEYMCFDLSTIRGA